MTAMPLRDEEPESPLIDGEPVPMIFARAASGAGIGNGIFAAYLREIVSATEEAKAFPKKRRKK